MKAFDVIEPGLHTTIQDRGRYGYQQYGVGPSGAMDEDALVLGNLLVKNRRDAAALEMIMIGPSLRAEHDFLIAITGANIMPTIDGNTIPMWSTVLIKKGQTLRFGKPVAGARAYLTVAGGFDGDEIMGSKSTYIPGQFGGKEGRILEAGDKLTVRESSHKHHVRNVRLHSTLIPTYESHQTVRVIEGPQEEMFTEEAKEAFYRVQYKITPQSNRMGYRLEGKQLSHIEESGIITDAVVKGSVQVPGNGQPIVLMADRQTTGGYPKIATIISVDLWKIAQLLPGQTISFQKTTVKSAHELLRERENKWKQIEILHGK
ncbi:biotin-dependent carboxyltransferase family protein [Bacillus shivajii]|uniref:5-oxoprolinase subunit C family protein n=1 Tax=Bacillus shivajii TaxID=1983719 RepID=UPI001CF9548D|nr:biotin-dependent carboxyltransferase family protein [Bacillus shivajii]UCZ53106.1 biotin-dependent carboxyltransferase family protein [Bacillus shivajii]